MLVLFFGNDTISVRQSAHEYAETKKEEGLTFSSLESGNFEPGWFLSVTTSDSLFGEKSVYLVDTPSENKEMYEELIESLPSLAESGNVFVVVEGSLLAAEKKKFEKCAEKVTEYKKAADARFNNFALADALSKKDKKSLWLLLSEARLEGISDEESIGILWWQLKTMRLALVTTSAAEAGIKDFPYSKAKRALAKFSDGELETLSHSLMSLSHDSRLGLISLDTALESWVLRL